MKTKLEVPVAIIGGGIAALWTLAKLRANGISAYLFCDQSLGGEQTMASQGMIHGGQRYSLQGMLTNHASISARMPKIWDDALEGKGEIDLSKTKILSNHQYLWSPGSLASNITGYFASKAMNASVKPLKQSEYPRALAFKKFKGKVYELPEIVLDIKSLVQNIYDDHKDFIYFISNEKLVWNNEQLKIELNEYEIVAEQVIFAAGLGNEKFLDLVREKREIYQRRPLKQILVKSVEDAFYGHAIMTDPRPRITVSAHPLDDGYCWYLGGYVASKDPNLSDDQAIDFAYQELKELFPETDWKSKSWGALYIDRAEPKAESGFLPDEPFVKAFGNVIVSYPTKLTFAPETGTKVMEHISSRNKFNEVLPLAKPKVALYPWENINWKQL